MINLKNKKGITLIALVITIIVLLILVGVALSLVLGEDGITERAINAGKTHNIAGAKEKVELEVANLGSEFYQAKYMNNSLPDGVSTVRDYVLANLPGSIDNYTLQTDADKKSATYGKVTLTATEGSDRTTETGTIDSDGKITWGGATLASANPCTVNFYSDEELTNLITTKTADSGETLGANMPSDPPKPADNSSYTYTFAGWKKSTDNSVFSGSTVISGNINVYANWTAEVPPVTVSSLTSNEYGQYFDLGTSIFNLQSVTFEEDGSHPLADWRIFSKDSEGGVWLILSDYLPINGNDMNTFITGTGANQIGLVTKTGEDLNSYPYSVWSGLNRTDFMTKLKANWKGLLPSSLQNDSNITAVGALTVAEWVESWNVSYPSNQITLSNYGNETDGYSGIELSSESEYHNTLYFPHRTVPSQCWGYWLASNYVGNPNGVVIVYCDGKFIEGNYDWTNYAVRPAVNLASSINITQDSETGKWSIAD